MAEITIDQKAIKADLSRDTREITSLWSQAIKDYTGKTGIQLVQPSFNSTDEMINFGTSEMNGFHKFRHDGSKVDKLRSLFMKNIEHIQAGSTMILNAAASTFPPAAAINTAMTFILSACKAVSAQYDVIINFFEDLNVFLQRVTIIEKRVPRQKAYQNTLMDVFASFLNMCGIAHSVIKQGRFKSFVMNMLGDAPDLAGGRKKMDSALKRLEEVGQFAIIDNTENLLDEQSAMKDRLSDYHAELRRNDEIQIRLAESQKILLESLSENLQELMREFRAGMKQFHQSADATSATEASLVPTSSGSATNPFRTTLRDLPPDMLPIITEFRETNVKGIGEWLFETSIWTAWLEDSSPDPLLLLVGEADMGKSSLAFVAYQRLQQHTQPGFESAAVYFPFSKVDPNFRTFDSAIASFLLQMADQSSILCEDARTRLRNEGIQANFWRSGWGNYFYDVFTEDSAFQLYIVIDDLDLVSEVEMQRFWDFVSNIRSRRSRIRIFQASNDTDDPSHDQIINLGRKEFSSALRIIVCDRLNSKDPVFDGLRRLRPSMQQKLARRIEQTADNLLHVEQALRYLGGIKREGAMIEAIETLPADIHALYDKTLEKCQQKMPQESWKDVRRIIGWIVFTSDPLTIGEIDEIGGIGKFPVSAADILDNFSPFFEIEINRGNDNVTDTKSLFMEDPSTTDDSIADDKLKMRLRNRSMKRFFGDIRSSSILCSSAADANYQIFLDTVSMITAESSTISTAHRTFRLLSWSVKVDIGEFSTEQKVGIYEAYSELLRDKTFTDKLVVSMHVRLQSDFEQLIASSEFKAKFLQWSSDARALPISGAAHDLWKDGMSLLKIFTCTSVRSFLTAPDTRLALNAFIMANTLMYTAEHPDCEERFEPNGDLSTYDGVMKLASLDPSISRRNTHFAIGVALVMTSAIDKAIESLRNALDTFNDHKQRIECLLELAKCYSILDDYPQIIECCEMAWHSNEQRLGRVDSKTQTQSTTEVQNKEQSLLASEPELTSNVDASYRACEILQMKSKAQYAMNSKSDAINSLARSRRIAVGIVPAAYLYDEVLYCKEENMSVLDILKKFTATQRFHLLTDPHVREPGIHKLLAETLLTSQRYDDLSKIYLDVIKLLDVERAGAPLRLQYARLLWSLRTNVKEIKALLNHILDSVPEAPQYIITEAYVSDTAGLALDLMTRVLQEEFHNSRSGQKKQQIYLDARDLFTRSLITASGGYTSSYAIPSQLIHAAMLKKIGPLIEYERSMRRIYTDIMDNLKDAIDVNDQLNLWYLAKLLTMEPALPEYSEMINSAIFYSLGPQGDNSEVDSPENDNIEEDGAEGEDRKDDSTREDDTEDYDLAYESRTCNGVCSPPAEWDSWEDGKIFQCLSCPQSWLCEDCHQIRLRMNDQTDDTAATPATEFYFCCNRDKYLVGPMKGWRGVRNGFLYFEGRDSENSALKGAPFKTLLDEIDAAWDKGWEKFWLEH